MQVHIYDKNSIDLSFIRINPLDKVVIKPNWVKEAKENDLNEWESVITSPYLIGLVAEYVCSHLSNDGELIICDAPQTDSSFDKIIEKSKMKNLVARLGHKYKVNVKLMDLRQEEWKNVGGIIESRTKLPGDPNGTVRFNLGKESLFYNYKGEGAYYGADYNTNEVNSHHHHNIHEYLVSATPIRADVIICMPKLKTHKKTGVTLSIKNLVGINADKNWLPHHTFGTPKNGGDEYPGSNIFKLIEQKGAKLAKKIAMNIPYLGTKIARIMRHTGQVAFGDGYKTIRSGNWYGNDTTWRMALDLNRCLLYGDSDGSLRNSSPKRYYTVIDGIIGMEGMGPMQGDRKLCGLVLASEDPIAADAVAARIMGFDWEKLPVIYEGLKPHKYPLSFSKLQDITIISNRKDWNGLSFEQFSQLTLFSFEPHFGWKGHIEIEK